MTALSPPAVAPLPGQGRAELVRRRRLIARVATLTENEGALLALLAAFSVLLGTWAQVASPTLATPASQTLPLMVGGLLLQRRRLRLLTLVVAAVIATNAFSRGLVVVRPGLVVVLGLLAVLADVLARGRQRVGITGLRGESMLAELRERLEAQGELPHLPMGWHAERALHPAGGGGFAGDFVVGARTRDGDQLEVALVDVSGKGLDAGTRALLLSGALGGLLGAVHSERFLAAANDYLCRQHWDEGFATAVHVALDLHTGAYVVTSAGHPPLAHFDAGSGRWRLSTAIGTVLGLVPDLTYVGETGVLRPGDALMLYTDGLVELPGRDLSVGIDKLVGEAERLVTGGFAGGAAHILHTVVPESTDDRAMLLLWRD